MSNSQFEPRISIREWIQRVYADDPKPPCQRTVKRWIERGAVRGGSTPRWFVYEDWEPRHAELAFTPKQARLMDKMAG